MNPIETIYINNVATAVEVINGVFKFPYNVGQELTAIRFVGSSPNTTLTKVNLKKRICLQASRISTTAL